MLDSAPVVTEFDLALGEALIMVRNERCASLRRGDRACTTYFHTVKCWDSFWEQGMPTIILQQQ